MAKRTFEEWMKLVDIIIADKVGGLTSMDLPDIDYSTMWRENKTPTAAANRAIRYAKDN